MENGTLSAGEADFVKVSTLVDSYVMAVTEGLCALESAHRAAMERPELAARKARILEGLDALDGLVAGFLETASRGSALSPRPPCRRGA